jgi:hypothetical protein
MRRFGCRIVLEYTLSLSYDISGLSNLISSSPRILNLVILRRILRQPVHVHSRKITNVDLIPRR